MDSKRLAEIADVMEDRGLTRVRVEEPDGTAVELERASAAQPVAVTAKKAQRDTTMLRLAGLKSSVKTHFSARAKIQAVMYLTLSPPVLKMLPTMHPIMLTREYSPGTAHKKATPKGE